VTRPGLSCGLSEDGDERKRCSNNDDDGIRSGGVLLSSASWALADSRETAVGVLGSSTGADGPLPHISSCAR
jgi:hypothetical protein